MRGLAAAAAGLALAASGCSTDVEAPTTLPPVTATPATTPTAVPTPSGISAPDAFGASAFARHFFAQVNEAYRTGRPELIRELSSSDCQTCNNFMRELDRVVSEAHRLEGGDFSVEFAEAAPPEQGVAIVDVAYRSSQTRELDRSGKLVKTFPGRPRTTAQVRVDYRDGRWVVRAIREVKV